MITKIKNKFKKFFCKKLIFCFLFIFFFLFFLTITKAQAASLSFSPVTGSHKVGDTFLVNILVTSSDQTMNAASGVISFPADKLEVISLNRTASIFSLWVQEPAFSNSTGIINFEGIVLNPGFTGASGKIIGINFKVKKAGEAPLLFSSGSILANDGKGTNLLNSLGEAHFTLSQSSKPIIEEEKIEEKKQETTNKPVIDLPPLPNIFSSTHPDINQWYNKKNVTFNWVLPYGVNGVNILADKKPANNPGTKSDGLMSSYTYEDVDDGVWYFHIRFRNSKGWGPISHFRFQIDTQKPEEFEIKFLETKITQTTRPTVLFNTTDKLSGIDYYEVEVGSGQIKNGEKVAHTDDMSNNPYTLPPQTPGKHSILVKAFDKAGNYITNSKDFVIEGVSAPIITEYSQNLLTDNELVVEGLSTPNSQIIFWLQKQDEAPKSYILQSDQNGNFKFLSKANNLKAGVYDFWAESVDSDGSRSYPTEKYTIIIKNNTLFKIGSWAVNTLSVLISLLALLFLLIVGIFYGVRKYLYYKNIIRERKNNLKPNLGKAYHLLEKHIKIQIKYLENKKKIYKLTNKEKILLSQLKKDLKRSELIKTK